MAKSRLEAQSPGRLDLVPGASLCSPLWGDPGPPPKPTVGGACRLPWKHAQPVGWRMGPRGSGMRLGKRTDFLLRAGEEGGRGVGRRDLLLGLGLGQNLTFG